MPRAPTWARASGSQFLALAPRDGFKVTRLPQRLVLVALLWLGCAEHEHPPQIQRSTSLPSPDATARTGSGGGWLEPRHVYYLDPEFKADGPGGKPCGVLFDVDAPTLQYRVLFADTVSAVGIHPTNGDLLVLEEDPTAYLHEPSSAAACPSRFTRIASLDCPLANSLAFLNSEFLLMPGRPECLATPMVGTTDELYPAHVGNDGSVLAVSQNGWFIVTSRVEHRVSDAFQALTARSMDGYYLVLTAWQFMKMALGTDWAIPLGGLKLSGVVADQCVLDGDGAAVCLYEGGIVRLEPDQDPVQVIGQNQLASSGMLVTGP